MRAAAVGADVYHSLGFRGPLRRGKIPTVVTVHDLVSIRFPELASPSARLYGNRAQRRMARIADVVICNSNDTANDVRTLFGVPSDRIRVTPLGVDEIFFTAAQPPVPASEPYILFVGSEQPRKNLERLEKAMVLLRARGFPHVLVTAGADAWGRVNIGASFLRRLGIVSDEELVSLYTGASCLAIPSLHEGFGLPALEAMAAGTAVVAARVGALPDVTGGAAVLVDPLDPADIADGLERAITERDSLVERGRQRAALFTWERTATMTTAVYRELA
jgi:glycosyltransferase involved in cell wall biosynthesis